MEPFLRFTYPSHSCQPVIISEYSTSSGKGTDGHSSIKITVDIYGQFIKSEQGVTAILDSNEPATIRNQEKGKASNP